MSATKQRITEAASVAHIRRGVSQAQALMESLQCQLTASRRRVTELEVELSLVEEDRDKALELLLWPFLVNHETTEEVLAFLDEHGLDPRKPEHAEEVATFLERKCETEDDAAK